MRIIKNGLMETEVDCMECGSLLAYTNHDVYEVEDQLMGLTIIDHYVKCPVCGHDIFIGNHYTYKEQ